MLFEGIDLDKYEATTEFKRTGALPSVKNREAARRKIQADIEAFLAAGGVIQKMPIRTVKDVKVSKETLEEVDLPEEVEKEVEE